MQRASSSDLPLAIDLDGIDLFGDLRTPLIAIAVMLALLMGIAVVGYLRAPVVHKRGDRS
jgi:hypothetical protein